MRSASRRGAAQREVSRLQVLIHIRDSRELGGDEKLFLYNLATHDHFKEFSTRDGLQKRLGMSDYKFRRTRKSVIDRGLVQADPELGSVTTYRLRPQALESFYEQTRDTAKKKASVAINQGGGRNRHDAPVDPQRGGHVEGRHQKDNRKAEQEKINKNGKEAVKGRRTVKVPRRVRPVRDDDDDELDIFR